MTPNVDDLPVPLGELPALLSNELDQARPRGLRVTAVQARPGHELVLLIDVLVEATDDRGPQRWRLGYEVPPADLTLLNGHSFVLTVRANIEEWWDTGHGRMPGLSIERMA